MIDLMESILGLFSKEVSGMVVSTTIYHTPIIDATIN
jgi:hypothetical protein